jgi:hypothetical protein
MTDIKCGFDIPEAGAPWFYRRPLLVHIIVILLLSGVLWAAIWLCVGFLATMLSS